MNSLINWFSVVGGVAGSFAAIIAFLAYRRDRPCLRIDVHDWMSAVPNTNISAFQLDVTNLGNRATVIVRAYALTCDYNFLRIHASQDNTFPRVLSDTQPTTSLYLPKTYVHQSSAHIYYFVIVDAQDREYRYYPSFSSWLANLFGRI